MEQFSLLSFIHTEGFSLRDDGEDQESSVAGTGHAQSVSPAGGAGSLHNEPNREPECERLHLWSYCKLFVCASIILCHDLFCEMIYIIQKCILSWVQLLSISS